MKALSKPGDHTPKLKTGYLTRGKVHLLKVEKGEPVETQNVSWCGVRQEDTNHTMTSRRSKCNCQKCLKFSEAGK